MYPIIRISAGEPPKSIVDFCKEIGLYKNSSIGEMLPTNIG